MKKTIILLIVLLVFIALSITGLIIHNQSHLVRVSDLDNQCLLLSKKIGHSITLKECLELKN